MKDRDEEHYDHEESEYHFSDDDVSYEIETEASKPVAPEPEKKNPMANLTQSKRMMISLVVFFGLVFVVYKMVSPSNTVPSTDISPVATTQTITQEIAPPPLPHTVQAPAQTEAVPVMQQAAPTQAAAPQPEPAVTQQSVASAPTPAATTTTTTTVVSSPAPAPIQPVAVAPQAAPQPVASVPSQPVAQAAPQPNAVPAQASSMPPAPLTTPVASAPVPAPAQAQAAMPVATTVVTAPAPITPGNTDASIAAMAATNEKLMNQLQAEYSQKVSDFGNQTKALQENMQTLNSRVAGLESQLTQLVQTLSRQTGMGGGNTSLNVVPAQQPVPIVQPKISYNVQAIIPGRAWLKSDNGETLTVAEGDSIRELGRVTKIDPYDGVVEVNTGNKTVSISYGSGG